MTQRAAEQSSNAQPAGAAQQSRAALNDGGAPGHDGGLAADSGLLALEGLGTHPLSVLVLGPDAKPIPGATVTLLTTSATWEAPQKRDGLLKNEAWLGAAADLSNLNLGVTKGAVPAIPILRPPERAERESAQQAPPAKPLPNTSSSLPPPTDRLPPCTTDPTGRCTWADVQQGPVQLFAHHPSWAPAKRELEAGTWFDREITFELTQGQAVHGRVLSPDGSPLPGIHVELRSPALAAALNTQTNSLGRFAFPAMTPPYSLLAMSTSGITTTFEARSSAGQNQLDTRLIDGELKLFLATGPHRIFGEVRTDRGATVPNARVSVHLPSARMNHRLNSPENTQPNAATPPLSEPTLTDRQGEFSIPGLAAGDYSLHIQARELAPVRIAIRAPQSSSTEVTLSSGVHLRGQVRDPRGFPIDRAQIQFEGPSARGQSKTDTDGQFEFRHLTPGNYTLKTSHLEFVELTTAAQLQAQPYGRAVEVNLTLEPSQASSAPQTPDQDAEQSPPARHSLFTRPGLELDSHLRVTAVRAGTVRVGDVLLTVNGERVLSAAQARSMLRGPAGTRIAVVVKRGKQRTRLKLRRPNSRTSEK